MVKRPTRGAQMVKMSRERTKDKKRPGLRPKPGKKDKDEKTKPKKGKSRQDHIPHVQSTRDVSKTLS